MEFGIEEQFYIFWPFLLWISWRKKISLLLVTIIIIFGSFFINIGAIYSNPVAAFYSPFSRFWELLIGAILAYVVLYTKLSALIKEASIRNGISLIGGILLGVGVSVFEKYSHFPGWLALIPTLGAACIIFAGPSSWINKKLLSNRVLVWFGLISFPLYLWHWPMLSFARIIQGEKTSVFSRLILVAVSILFSWLTYRLVELPLRKLPHKKVLTFSLFFLVSALGVIGFFAYKDYQLLLVEGVNGHEISKNKILYNKSIKKNEEDIKLSTDSPDEAVYTGDIGFDAINNYIAKNNSNCLSLKNGFQIGGHWLGSNIGCSQSKQSENVDMAIVGDSHAGHLFVGFSEEFPSLNILALSLYGINGLPYIANDKFNAVFDYLQSSKIQTIIISNYWANPSLDFNSPKAVESLRDTVNALTAAGKVVLIVDDVPAFSFDPANCKAIRNLSHTRRCADGIGQFNKAYNSYMPTLMHIIKNNPRTHLLKSFHLFCNSSECSMQRDEVLLYADRTHLNMDGSRFFARALHKDVMNYHEQRK